MAKAGHVWEDPGSGRGVFVYNVPPKNSAGELSLICLAAHPPERGLQHLFGAIFATEANGAETS
jgi:hypothetical protein